MFGKQCNDSLLQVWIVDVTLADISSRLGAMEYGASGAAYVLTETDGVDYLVGASEGGVRCFLTSLALQNQDIGL